MLRTVCRRWTGVPLRRVRLLSTLPEEAHAADHSVPPELSEYRESVVTSEDGLLLRSVHASHFAREEGKSVFDLRPGAYQSVSAEKLRKYLPEGLAGEAAKEFAFTKQPAWMVRESTRLLCRLLEERETALKKPWKNASHTAQGLHSVIALPRLTDRPEWGDAQVEVSRYGERLVTVNDKELLRAQRGDESETMYATKGAQSFTEKIVKRINDKGGVPDKIMLTGRGGSGKSMVLNQLVMHARERGWLAVFVPSAWAHSQCGPYVEPVMHAQAQAQKKTLFDNPIMSAAALRDLHKAHGELLKTMPIANTQILKKYNAPIQHFIGQYQRAMKVRGREGLNFLQMREIIREDDHYAPADELDAPLVRDLDFPNFSLHTLADLITLGIALSDCAGLCFYDLVQELKDVDSVPVLFAVDEYNAWFGPSAFSFADQRVDPLDLCVPRALHFLDKKKGTSDAFVVKNGLCVAATSLSHAEGRGATMEDSISSLPLRVRVPVYNQTEYLSALSYYLTCAPLDPSLSYEDFLHYRMHTGSVPRNVRNETVPFFLPRSVQAADAELRLAMISAWAQEGVVGGNEGAEDAEGEEDLDLLAVTGELEEDVTDKEVERILVEEHPDVLAREDLDELRQKFGI